MVKKSWSIWRKWRWKRKVSDSFGEKKKKESAEVKSRLSQL